MKKLTSFFLIIILIFSFSACSEKKVTKHTVSLDTIVTITCYGKNADKASDEAIKEIERIHSVFSAFDENSEVYKINENASYEPVKISQEVLSVIEKCLEMSKLTDGAFDITVKPLTEIWNVKAENPKVPEESQIEDALSKIGWENIEIADGYISFKKEGMKIDLGGAVKGYACDRAKEIITSYGIKNALLDLGGNLYALGKSESGKPWKVGIQDPSQMRGESFKTLNLSDVSCVTSGSYERYFEENGKIYHHILDTKTGYPVDKGLISVTVVSSSSFEADMLSTAIFALGEERIKELKEKYKFQECIVVDKQNNFRVY